MHAVIKETKKKQLKAYLYCSLNLNCAINVHYVIQETGVIRNWNKYLNKIFKYSVITAVLIFDNYIVNFK